MRKLSTITVTAVAVGTLLFGYAHAQQSSPPASSTPPPASSSQAPAAKTPASPAAKTGTTTAAKKPAPPVLTLKTNKDKASYAIGVNMGKSMRKDSVDIDPSILARGLKDGLAGGKTLLTDDEARAAMVALQADVGKKQQEKMKEAGAANKKEGDAFLAENKGKEGVITLPSGLQYKILTAGTGPKPTASDTVVCNYKGTLINGTEFDSSYKRGQPATFPVGGVIKGWTEALQLMPVGSKWELFVPSELAYGPQSRSAEIGPNSTLIFDVELLSIQDKSKDKAPAPAKDPDKK